MYGFNHWDLHYHNLMVYVSPKKENKPRKINVCFFDFDLAAVENNIELPKTYSGYSFHAYDTIPLPTKYLKNFEVLKMRDEAFINYHTDKKYLKKIEENFGSEAKKNIEEMTKIKLKRRIIEEAYDN